MRPQNLSPRALRDIERAADDIAASAAGAAFADRFAVAVADAAERVLVYDAEHPVRLILRVVHMARDLGPLLADLAGLPGEDQPD